MPLDLNFLSYSFLIAALSSFLLGIAKAGVKGIAALIVAGLALAYGAKESTGILMPLLICGDIFAVLYYNCLLYTSPSPRDLSTSRMPSSA